MFPSLGQAVIPTPSFPQLPIDLCVGLWHWGLLLVQFGMPIMIILVQIMSGQSWWWDFLCVASDITERHNRTLNSHFCYNSISLMCGFWIISLIWLFYPYFLLLCYHNTFDELSTNQAKTFSAPISFFSYSLILKLEGFLNFSREWHYLYNRICWK